MKIVYNIIKIKINIKKEATLHMANSINEKIKKKVRRIINDYDSTSEAMPALKDIVNNLIINNNLSVSEEEVIFNKVVERFNYEKTIEERLSNQQDQSVTQSVNKKNSFKFYANELKSKHNTYRNYLEKRCEKLPAEIERHFKTCTAYHIASTAAGMSNYIEVSTDDKDNIYTIRISDHKPTSSGDPCDYYIYIQNKTWLEIKKEVFETIKNFLNE